MRERVYDTKSGQLNALIAILELKSHVPAAQIGKSVHDSTDDIGGKRPTGGIDRRDDREPDSILKSADYFRRKRTRCRSDNDIDRLITEITAVLDAWRRMPVPPGQPPAPGDPQWKRWVAESKKDAGELARLFNISRQRVHQIRKQYRDAA